MSHVFTRGLPEYMFFLVERAIESGRVEPVPHAVPVISLGESTSSFALPEGFDFDAEDFAEFAEFGDDVVCSTELRGIVRSLWWDHRSWLVTSTPWRTTTRTWRRNFMHNLICLACCYIAAIHVKRAAWTQKAHDPFGARALGNARLGVEKHRAADWPRRQACWSRSPWRRCAHTLLHPGTSGASAHQLGGYQRQPSTLRMHLRVTMWQRRDVRWRAAGKCVGEFATRAGPPRRALLVQCSV